MYTVINVITTVCNDLRYGSIHRAGIGPIGRERPHALFGRLKAEKVGSLPPVFVVSIPMLFGSSTPHRILFQRSAGPQGEDLGEERCEE
jgi:hypothetical protein